MQKTNYLDVELDDLRVLQSLYETRNTTRTAEHLNKSQPGVSRVLARLRRVLGDPLLVKAPGGMILTDRALALRGQLTQTIASIEALLSPKQFDPKEAEGVFRLSTTDYGALAILPSLMPRLTKEAPGISLEVLPFSGDVFRHLAEGRTDMVLFSDDPVPLPLRTRTLYTEGYSCLVGPSHRLAGKVDVSLDEFLGSPHALVSILGGRTGVVDDALQQLGLSRHIGLWLPYFATAANVIAITDLILTLPSRSATALARSVGLHLFPLPLVVPTFDYRLIWHERSQADPAHLWLRDLVFEGAS
ncbi:LysR family transcriptional regulator [Mesorhizobium sp. INR15]|uniref:LysR family transcriptional regulator n=1 Tax=Mesorhizobium sp. INR15 TaxID=2654248 RepID=UPI0018967113|nr:LysR family transcriptional regulator [Mesorhizobium sp. INR15]QPC95901.1 LysR family transcriptional regulator [Mesorhizobium sp. INR15]